MRTKKVSRQAATDVLGGGTRPHSLDHTARRILSLVPPPSRLRFGDDRAALHEGEGCARAWKRVQRLTDYKFVLALECRVARR